MSYALITGASTGIARELARVCAKDGHDLILVARSREKLEAVAGEIRGLMRRTVQVMAKDFSGNRERREVFDEVARSCGSVDALVNNAGFGLVGKFRELDAARQVDMELNVMALTCLSRLFLPGMIDRRRGHILNVASRAAFQPGPLMAVYYATKSYVVSLSEAIHNEAREYGVVVSCLCPVPTKTELAERSGARPKTKLFSERRRMSAAEVAGIERRGMKRGRRW